MYGEGADFHGEYSSTDATAGALINLYGAGSTAALTPLSTDWIVVTDFSIVSDAAMQVDLFDGTDMVVDDGERIAEGKFQQGGGEVSGLKTPHFCQIGTRPRVLASETGQVSVIISGYIISKPGG